jgi:nitrite reductase/ring-hydroxylating ferredoxin subunit
MKRVASVPFASLKPNKPFRVAFPPYDVLVVRIPRAAGSPSGEDEVFALEDACNHAGAPLSEGPVTKNCGIICPMHGYVFDLRTGKLTKPKGLCDDQRKFEARREGDEVVIYDPFELAIVPA